MAYKTLHNDQDENASPLFLPLLLISQVPMQTYDIESLTLRWPPHQYNSSASTILTLIN